MAVVNIFNPNVVDDEAEKDRLPFVAPEAGSGVALVVAMLG